MAALSTAAAPTIHELHSVAMTDDTRSRPHRFASVLATVTALLALAGCGAEVAGGAAVVGAMQAEQATQARQQQAQVVDGLKAAQAASLARAASAAD